MYRAITTSALVAFILLSVILPSDAGDQPSAEVCPEEPAGDSLGTVPDECSSESDSTGYICECLMLLPPPCPEELKTGEEAPGGEIKSCPLIPEVI